MSIRLPLALAAALLVLGACAARPTAEWRDDSYTGPVRDVLIIGVSEQTATRKLFEDTFVTKLAEHGVTATASSTLMPSDEKISRETVETAIDGESIATVIVTRLLGVEERETYYEPATTRYYGSYYSYYSQSWHYADSGYFREYKVLKLETNVYDVATGNLVYSMQSENIDPQSATQVIEEQIDLTIDTLGKQKLL